MWLLYVGDRESCNAGTDSRDSRYAVGGRWRETDLNSTVLETCVAGIDLRTQVRYSKPSSYRNMCCCANRCTWLVALKRTKDLVELFLRPRTTGRGRNCAGCPDHSLGVHLGACFHSLVCLGSRVGELLLVVEHGGGGGGETLEVRMPGVQGVRLGGGGLLVEVRVRSPKNDAH